MKPLVLLVLIAFLSTLPQDNSEEPELQVVKFSWFREKQTTRMIRGAQNPGGPVTTPINDGRDLGSRKAEIRTIGRRAVKTDEAKPTENYQLRLELKNTSANVVKGLVWELRPAVAPEDYQAKQYLCALQVKPKEKKLLEIWTPYVPVKVISAKKPEEASKDDTVVINQIEYADGSVWKKPGWNFKLPADSLRKLADGTCSVF